MGQSAASGRGAPPATRASVLAMGTEPPELDASGPCAPCSPWNTRHPARELAPARDGVGHLNGSPEDSERLVMRSPTERQPKRGRVEDPQRHRAYTPASSPARRGRRAGFGAQGEHPHPQTGRPRRATRHARCLSSTARTTVPPAPRHGPAHLNRPLSPRPCRTPRLPCRDRSARHSVGALRARWPIPQISLAWTSGSPVRLHCRRGNEAGGGHGWHGRVTWPHRTASMAGRRVVVRRPGVATMERPRQCPRREVNRAFSCMNARRWRTDGTPKSHALLHPGLLTRVCATVERFPRSGVARF